MGALVGKIELHSDPQINYSYQRMVYVRWLAAAVPISSIQSCTGDTLAQARAERHISGAAQGDDDPRRRRSRSAIRDDIVHLGKNCGKSLDYHRRLKAVRKPRVDGTTRGKHFGYGREADMGGLHLYQPIKQFRKVSANSYYEVSAPRKRQFFLKISTIQPWQQSRLNTLWLFLARTDTILSCWPITFTINKTGRGGRLSNASYSNATYPGLGYVKRSWSLSSPSCTSAGEASLGTPLCGHLRESRTLSSYHLSREYFPIRSEIPNPSRTPRS